MAGILFGASLAIRSWTFFAAAGAGLLVYILFRKWRTPLLLLWGLFFLMAGAITWQIHAPVPYDLSQPHTIEARVAAVTQGEYNTRYHLINCRIDGRKQGRGIYLTAPAGLGEDDLIRGEVTLAKPGSDGEFNDLLYCAAKGVTYRAQGEDLTVTGKAKDLLSVAHALRAGAETALEELCGPHAPTAKALLLGVQDELPHEIEEGFRQTGISHLLVVSGLHVGLLAGIVAWILRKCKCGRICVMAVTAAFVLFYALLTGLKTPVLRASLMLLLYTWGKTRGYRTDGLTTLSAALLFFLFINPASLFDVGLQLSFTAVLSLLCLDYMGGRARNPLLQGLGGSLAVSLGTLPQVARLSGSFWIPTVLINVFAILYTGVLLPLLALCLVAYLIGGKSLLFLGGPLQMLLAALESLSELSRRFPALTVDLPQVPGAALVAGLLALFFASRYFRGKWWEKLLPTLACLGAGICLCYL